MSSPRDVDAMLAPPPEPSSFLGSVVGHRYRVLELLGRGGMGAVFLAEHTELGTTVALKVMIAERGLSDEDVERFMREARAAVRIGHPNIVRIFDLGRTDDGIPFMAMEHLRGRDLDELLIQDISLPFEKALPILRGIASAIDAVHAEGFLHRDIKPANIFLSEENGRIVPKLLDFGLARLRDGRAEKRLTETGLIVGTPHYLAPEVGVGKDPTAASDQYSLAAVAYELLAGRLPFDDPNSTAILLAKVQHDPPPMELELEGDPDRLFAVETVMQRGLSRIASERFSSCTEFVEALAAAYQGAPVPADPPAAQRSGTEAPEPSLVSTGEAAQRLRSDLSLDDLDLPLAPLPSRRGPLVASLVVALIATVLAVFLMARPDGDEPEATPSVPEPPREPVTSDEPTAEDTPVSPSDEPAAPPDEPALVPDPEQTTRTRRRRATEMDAVVAMEAPPPAEPTMAEEPTAEDGPSAEELTRRGQRALLRGRLPDAARLFREATYRDPRHAAAWRSLGVAEERMGHAPEAKRAYARYLRLSPSAPDAAAIRRRADAL